MKIRTLLFIFSFLVVVQFLVSMINKDEDFCEKIICEEVKVVKTVFNNSVINYPVKLIYTSINLIYNEKQEEHMKRTNISVEKFNKLVSQHELILARSATFHNIHDCHNVKYLSRNGAYEYIVKVEKDEFGNLKIIKLINDPINRGTYNYFNQEGVYWQRSLHHVDVVFWLFYGTGSDDDSLICERIQFYFLKNSYCVIKEENHVEK